jgi:uncharacterized protein (TIGR02246 family)
MRNLAVLGACVLLGLATSALAADATDQVEQAVRELQSAWNEGDRDKVVSLVSEDHVSILSYAQFNDRQDLIEHMKSYAFTRYEMSDLKAIQFAPDTVLVMYRGTLVGTFEGEPVPQNVIVGRVWIREDGVWREALYQETPLSPP